MEQIIITMPSVPERRRTAGTPRRAKQALVLSSATGAQPSKASIKDEVFRRDGEEGAALGGFG